MVLRQPLGKSKRHGHGVLGHRLGVRANVACHEDPIRDRAEVDLVDPCRQQLDEPEGLGPRQQLGRNLAGKVPGKQDLRVDEDSRPPVPGKPLEKRDPGVAAEDLPVDQLELLVHRVAHGHLRQVQRPIGVVSRQSSPL